MTQGFWRRRIIGKIMLLFACLAVILAGVRTLMNGRLFYRNYWGGAFFAPLAICIGLFGTVITALVTAQNLTVDGVHPGGSVHEQDFALYVDNAH